MRTLKYLFLLGIMASFVLTSCNKDDQNVEPQTNDNELLSAIYASDALIGKGEKKDDNTYDFTVKVDDLGPELRKELEGRESLTLDADLKISEETAKGIWGESFDHQGLEIKAGELDIKKTYMSSDGEDLSAAVENDPTILQNARDRDILFEYLFVSHQVIYCILPDGSVLVVEIIYIEWCVVIG